MSTRQLCFRLTQLCHCLTIAIFLLLVPGSPVSGTREGLRVRLSASLRTPKLLSI